AGATARGGRRSVCGEGEPIVRLQRPGQLGHRIDGPLIRQVPLAEDRVRIDLAHLRTVDVAVDVVVGAGDVEADVEPELVLDQRSAQVGAHVADVRERGRVDDGGQ